MNNARRILRYQFKIIKIKKKEKNLGEKSLVRYIFQFIMEIILEGVSGLENLFMSKNI